MTDLDDLRHELERLGRRPVPAARPEFVEGLLTRIVGDTRTGEVPAPIPLRPVAPRRVVAPRAIALVSVAATLLLAVGVVGFLARDVAPSGEIEASYVAATTMPTTVVPAVTATTAAPLGSIGLRNLTADGGDVIRLAWDAYTGPAADVVYVVLRTAGDRTTETVVDGTTYTEPVPTEVVDLSFSVEVRSNDTVVARGDSLVTIKVTSAG